MKEKIPIYSTLRPHNFVLLSFRQYVFSSWLDFYGMLGQFNVYFEHTAGKKKKTVQKEAS